VGLLPRADEVLAAFPGRELLIDVKNDAAADGDRVADLLAAQPAARLAGITVSGDAAIGVVRSRLPAVRVTSRSIMQDCMTRYLATGWSGYVPDACRHTMLRLPQRYGRWMWGWPGLFERRLREVDTGLVLVAGDGPWAEGFDDAADLKAAGLDGGGDYAGWVWTDRVDVVAPLLRR
jgi:glycerophosphoryl diester phosphodiesterase